MVNLSAVNARKCNDIQFITFCNDNIEYPIFMAIKHSQAWTEKKEITQAALLIDSNILY